jgi:hypothetical protein
MSISSILKGVGGELEAGRVIWVFGSASFVVSFIAYAGIALWAKGQQFSPIEYGTGFGGGFSAVLAAGGFAIKQKDTGVATAVLTRDGTATPATEQGS